jgi:hypothetical protein
MLFQILTINRVPYHFIICNRIVIDISYIYRNFYAKILHMKRIFLNIFYSQGGIIMFKTGDSLPLKFHRVFFIVSV